MSEKITYTCDKCKSEGQQRTFYNVEIRIKHKPGDAPPQSGGYHHIVKDYCDKCWKAISEVL